jgi:hypothetical protein
MSEFLLFHTLLAGAEESDELKRRLEAANIRQRLGLLDTCLTALVGSQDIEDLGTKEGTIKVDQARAVIGYCVRDRSWRVRRRLAQRLPELHWQESVPIVASLAWDPDDRVREAAILNLDAVEALRAPRGRRFVDQLVGYDVAREMLIHELTRGKPSQGMPALDPLSGNPLSGEPPPSGGPPSDEEDEEIVRRYTDCDFIVDSESSSSGLISFALRIEALKPKSRPVDLRIPPGRESVGILVHAFSEQFAVGAPETRVIQVPRAADSETASFNVRAEGPAVGQVGLLVFDENRLIGSLSLQLRASQGEQGLTLEKIGEAIFRDPAPAGPSVSNGLTIQVSLREHDHRIAYHVLLPDKAHQPTLFPLGCSTEPMEAAHVQTALSALREQVAEIYGGLENPVSLGVQTKDEVLQLLRLNLESPGRLIAQEVLSPCVVDLLIRSQGSVVNLVIRNSSLDIVPWELAWNQSTDHHFNQDLVLVRTPVKPPEGVEDVRGTSLSSNLPPARDRLYYFLGDGVVEEEKGYQFVRDVVRSVGKFEVVDNFEGNQPKELTVLELKDILSEARVVHILCHGLEEDGKNRIYLRLGEKLANRLYPSLVRGFRLPPNALIFVNSCSSASPSASFSLSGFTTLGWSFFHAGARAYIGTLAPVTTRVACRFAQAFFEAHLDRELPLPVALLDARRQLADERDPTWLLYTLYGDLSREEPTVKLLT